jgi:hypothetical protein
MSILNDNDHTNLYDIHWDPIYVSFSDKSQKKIVEATKDKIRFFAKFPKLTIKQHITLFIMENLIFIILGFSISLYVIAKVKIHIIILTFYIGI